MPCEVPFRDDSSQRLLFKIASCCFSGEGGAGVTSFNGRDGVVTLTSGDVTGVADDIYVNESGDSMTGALSIDNGSQVASVPYLSLSQTWNNAAVTFTGLLSNVVNTASNSDSNLFNFQSDGIDRFRFAIGGQLYATRQDATNSGVTFFLRKRGNTLGATNAVAADSAIGTLAHSGWDGTAYATGSRITGEASEAWTNIAHGSRIRFYTTPIGSTVEQITLQLSNTGQTQLLDGTAALPALTFQSDPDTGMRRVGANDIGFSVNGADMARLNLNGLGIGGVSSSFRLELIGTSSTANRKIGINGVQVLYLPDQTNFSRSIFFGNGGQFLSHAAGAEGFSNTGVGRDALLAITTGAGNTGIGSQSLLSLTTGDSNVGIGNQALQNTTTGISNLGLGTSALLANVTGSNNVGIGTSTLTASTGSGGTGVGTSSLLNVTTGVQNTALGFNTGLGITTGSNNTIVGANVTGLAAGLSNNIILADGAGAIRLQIDSSGNTSLAGNLSLETGKTLSMASGANQRAGDVVLIAGTRTVANTTVTANTRVFLTRKVSGGTLGTAITYTVAAGVSFTVNSDSALDTSTFSYLLVEVP